MWQHDMFTKYRDVSPDVNWIETKEKRFTENKNNRYEGYSVPKTSKACTQDKKTENKNTNTNMRDSLPNAKAWHVCGGSLKSLRTTLRYIYSKDILDPTTGGKDRTHNRKH